MNWWHETVGCLAQPVSRSGWGVLQLGIRAVGGGVGRVCLDEGRAAP